MSLSFRSSIKQITVLHNKRMLIAFLIGFVTLAVLAAIAIGSAYSYSRDRIQTEINNKEQLLADVQRSLLLNTLEDPLKFIKMVQNSDSIQRYQQAPAENLGQLQEYLQKFMADSTLFDHTHLFGRDGTTIFMVDNSAAYGGAIDVSTELTDTEDDIVNKILTTPRGSIFVSIFSHENDPDETTKLTDLHIHLGMPQFNEQGELIGGLLFGYPFQNVSDSFILDDDSRTVIGYIMLMDEEGNYIFNEKANAGNEISRASFKNEYPTEWRSITERSNGQLQTDNGVFTFHTIDLNANIPGSIVFGPDHKLVLATYMDPKKITLSQGNFNHIYTNILIFLCLTIPFLAYLLALIYSLITVSRDTHKHRAQHDPLTGLANRKRFLDVTQQALDGLLITKTNLAIAYFDLDDFKKINDTLGHEVGDEVLKQVAKNTRASLRQNDLVARLGGDEFVVLLNDIKDISEVQAVGQRIQQAIQTPIEYKNSKLTINSSIGIWIVTEPNCVLNEMLTKADEAMYRAKREGKNRVVIGNAAAG